MAVASPLKALYKSREDNDRRGGWPDVPELLYLVALSRTRAYVRYTLCDLHHFNAPTNLSFLKHSMFAILLRPLVVFKTKDSSKRSHTPNFQGTTVVLLYSTIFSNGPALYLPGHFFTYFPTDWGMPRIRSRRVQIHSMPLALILPRGDQ